MAEFTTDFENTCTTWPPAVAAGFTFENYLVEAGDYQGKNADTQAKIFCVWLDGTVQTPFTSEVAVSLGANVV
ncbi:hypothetical protein C8R47DRAFT_1210760 [Mycena vitilis]|nr:hypothetical protein C8R47DRAFT_1210760 [Mycena vitilis]